MIQSTNKTDVFMVGAVVMFICSALSQNGYLFVGGMLSLVVWQLVCIENQLKK